MVWIDEKALSAKLSKMVKLGPQKNGLGDVSASRNLFPGNCFYWILRIIFYIFRTATERCQNEIGMPWEWNWPKIFSRGHTGRKSARLSRRRWWKYPFVLDTGRVTVCYYNMCSVTCINFNLTVAYRSKYFCLLVLKLRLFLSISDQSQLSLKNSVILQGAISYRPENDRKWPYQKVLCQKGHIGTR